MLKVLTASLLTATAVFGQINGQWTQNRLPGTSTVWTAWRTSNEVWAVRSVATGAVGTAVTAYVTATGAAAVAGSAYTAATGAVATAGTAYATATGATAVAGASYTAATGATATAGSAYTAATGAVATAATSYATATGATATAWTAYAAATGATATAGTAYTTATGALASAASATNTAAQALAAAASATNTAAAAEDTADNAEFLASIALNVAETYYAPSTNAQAVALGAAVQAQAASSNALAVYAISTNALNASSNALLIASYPTAIWGGLSGLVPGAQPLTAWQSLSFTAAGVPRISAVTWETNTWWTTWKTAYPTNVLGDDLAVSAYNNGVAQTIPASAGFPAGPCLPYPSGGADQWEWEKEFSIYGYGTYTNVHRLTTLTNASGVSLYFAITNRFAGYLYGTNVTADVFTNATEFWLAPLNAGVTQAMRLAWNRSAPATSVWDVASQTDMTHAQGDISDLFNWVESEFPAYLGARVATNDETYLETVFRASVALTSAPPQTVVSVNGQTGAVSITAVGLGALNNEQDLAALRTYHYGRADIVETATNWFAFDGTGTITGYSYGAPADVVIPWEIGGVAVTNIGISAFLDPESEPEGYGYPITTVTLPRSVISVGESAFYRCSSLTSVSMPAVTSIGAYSFSECEQLVELADAGALQDVGAYAFMFDTALSAAPMPSAVSIGASAFYDCDALASVDLPSAVTIGDFAFSLSGVVSATIPAAAGTLGSSAFGGTPLVSIDIPAGVSAIGDSAFAGAAALTAVNFAGDEPALLGSDVYLGADSVTNYVTNPTATGWGATFGGRPVVRLPLFTDALTLGGTTRTNWPSAPTDAAQIGGITTNGGTLTGPLYTTRDFNTDAPTDSEVASAGWVRTNLNAHVNASANAHTTNAITGLATALAVRPTFATVYTNMLWGSPLTNATYRMSWDATNGTFKVEEILP